MYLEHRYLYRRTKTAGPLDTTPVPIGQALVRREGTQATIITYATGVHQALEAAERLAGEGVSVEVIDIRTLVPLDIATITESVRKTTRAIVLHEDARRFGYGAEIASVDPGGVLLVPRPAGRPHRREGRADPVQRPARGRRAPERRSDRRYGSHDGHDMSERGLGGSTVSEHDVIVVGGGPGGYASALYGASAGLDVALIEDVKLGGTCLNRGCIPAKALLQAAEVARTVAAADSFGIVPDGPGTFHPDWDKVNARKNGIIDRLVGGLGGLLKKRG